MTRHRAQLQALIRNYSPKGALVKIPQPGATRWSSLHRSITAFLTLEPALRKVVEHELQHPSDIDGLRKIADTWTLSRVSFFKSINPILGYLAESLTLLEGQEYPTLSRVQEVAFRLKIKCEEKMPQRTESTFGQVLKEMLRQIKTRFDVFIHDPTEDAYFPSELIASALDPHTKKLYFVTAGKRGKIWGKVRQLMDVVRMADVLDDHLEEDEELGRRDLADDLPLSAILTQRVPPRQIVRSGAQRLQGSG
eukprot:TRINITY_DN392_c0_g1_i2.p1 TRINITY_DN392_c0_g1~~TRINITY_DN392_c0_g1_i2.p1  ORF type:complete len:251 (+),score=31.29 TRINITY_DN392_c0_g1_i2:689-1441(+)